MEMLDESRSTAPGTLSLRVGCEFAFTCDVPTPAVALLAPRVEADRVVLEERWDLSAPTAFRDGRDLYGNRIHRLILPAGDATLRYDAIVRASDRPDETDLSTPQTPPEEVPDDVLVYVLPSRFCPSDRLSDVAWGLFGATNTGWGRVQAVSDWVYQHVAFAYEASDPTATALDTYERRTGVCRDFTHLAIALCRALNIPARYAFGYLPDIDVPPPSTPMDFCAWMEVYLGGRWWTFDPRNNQRRIGHIVIGRGRDATDVAMITSFGFAFLQKMTVWADRIS